MTKQTGIIALMTVKGGSGKSDQAKAGRPNQRSTYVDCTLNPMTRMRVCAMRAERRICLGNIIHNTN